MASTLAASMKPQVLTMTASQPSMSPEMAKPARASLSSMSSASTWFLGHPREIIPTVF